MDRPSKRKDVYWCMATSCKPRPETPDPVGKFLIFEFRKDVDEAWAKIKNATEEDRLGFASKVSTRKKKPARIGGGTDNHVICVYTSTSPEDKARVKKALNRLGFVRHLPYKTDAETEAGVYGPRASHSKDEAPPKSKNVLKLSKNKGVLHISQLYPEDPEVKDKPSVICPLKHISEVSNAFYKLANSFVPKRGEVEGLDSEYLHMWAEYYRGQPAEFDEMPVIFVEMKGGRGGRKVKFPQDEGMFCYKRLEWYRTSVLGEKDTFSSDESPDDSEGEDTLEKN